MLVRKRMAARRQSVSWKLRTTPKLTSRAPIKNIQRAAGQAVERGLRLA